MKNWIKNKLQKLLERFGFIPQSMLDFAISEHLKEKTKWFEKPEIVPTREQGKNETWGNYWEEQYEPHFFAWYVRSISKYPKILQSLFLEISKYDFDKVGKYMKDNDWFWNNNKHSPTKHDLIDTVVDLTFSCIDGKDFDGHNYGDVSTGGFSVSIVNQKVTIAFNKHGEVFD